MTYSVFIPPSPVRLQNKLETIDTESLKKEPQHYAVLIGGNTEDRHRNNLSLAYQILIEQGYKRTNIFVFDSEGGNPAIFPITDTTTYKTMEIFYAWIAEQVTPQDTLLIYMTGHGNKLVRSNESAHALNKSEKLSKSQFITFIKKIQPKIGIVFGDFCYWGAIDPYQPGLEQYIFITATNDDRVSYGTTFARSFWNSFRKYNKKVPSLLEIYYNALFDDPLFGRKDANDPSLSFFKTRPERTTILGEEIN
jgi:hypothetical protein